MTGLILLLRNEKNERYGKEQMMAEVERFDIFEQAFTHVGSYDNPYVALEATAQWVAPDGTEKSIPLFWDGGTTWRLRFSPAQVGQWQWSTQSSDDGLNGQSGAFDVVDSKLRGGLRAQDNFLLHFQYQNGDPVWFAGDTAWALMTDNKKKKHDRTAVEHYLNTRASQGFNVVHSMMISEAGWGNCGGDAFDDLQAEQINPGYWQEADERVIYANSIGITVGIVLAWGDKGKNPNDWREFPSQEARERYARFIAARYGAMNTYFIVAGEWNGDLRQGVSEEQARADYNAIGQVIYDHDPHGRFIGIHPMIWGTSREFASELWCSFGDYQQMYPNLHREILTSREINMPVVNSEYAYYLRDQDEDGICDKQNSHDIDTIRHATWDIVMAGGYFITGWGNTYFGGHRNPTPFDVDAEQNDNWEEQVAFVIRFFKDLMWWRLSPRDEIISAAVERGEDGVREFNAGGGTRKHALPPEIAYWALADNDMLYVVYVRGIAEEVTLDLGGGAFLVERFNPRTGERTDLGEVHTSCIFVPPDLRDWVVVVRRK